MSESESSTASTQEFQNIINDFVNDLTLSYPELQDQFNCIDYDEYHSHCKSIYPKHFFHILYENSELFDDDESKFMLPGIDFHRIMNDESLSEKSKKTIWKYLQLLLFCVCNGLENSDQFGDTSSLFEAIDENDLHKKIQNTMEDMKSLFKHFESFDGSSSDSSGEDAFTDQFKNIQENFQNMFPDISNMPDLDSEASKSGSSSSFFENMMDADKMKEHLSSIMDGKIGNLAKEIAEEASQDLGLDVEEQNCFEDDEYVNQENEYLDDWEN